MKIKQYLRRNKKIIMQQYKPIKNIEVIKLKRKHKIIKYTKITGEEQYLNTRQTRQILTKMKKGEKIEVI